MSYRIKISPRQRIILGIRKKVIGTPSRPRLVVFRSLKNIYAQLVDDINHKTITAVSSLNKEVKDEIAGLKKPEKPENSSRLLGTKVTESKTVGKVLAEKAKGLKITGAVFDRHGYQYHGRIKAVADGAREAGLKF